MDLAESFASPVVNKDLQFERERKVPYPILMAGHLLAAFGGDPMLNFRRERNPEADMGYAERRERYLAMKAEAMRGKPLQNPSRKNKASAKKKKRGW